jgi:hypothetical protein
MKRALALWAAIVVPTWLVLALCTYWEPVVTDGWGHLTWQRDLDLHTLWVFAKSSYYGNNPRLGQIITLLLYTPGGWHVAVTPVVELAMFYLVAALAIGRWPSLRRADDALLYLTVLAIGLATAPCIGQMLFYRPYTGNYVYAVAINLLLLVPYRFHAERPRDFGWWFAPIILVLGFAAGMCNEHTGIAIGAAIVIAMIAFRRRGDRIALWMVAGAIGLAVGYVMLLIAPGHSFRYGGIAEQSLLARVEDRGVLGNAAIIGRLLLHAAIALPWLAIAWLRRGERLTRPSTIACAVALVVAALATCALYASPKIGERLYLPSTLMITVATAAWVHAQSRARRIAAALSVSALVVVGALVVPAYYKLGPAGARRIEALERATPGSTVTLDRLPVRKNYFTVGEDLDDPARRAVIARDYGLSAIELRAE